MRAFLHASLLVSLFAVGLIVAFVAGISACAALLSGTISLGFRVAELTTTPWLEIGQKMGLGLLLTVVTIFIGFFLVWMKEEFD